MKLFGKIILKRQVVYGFIGKKKQLILMFIFQRIRLVNLLNVRLN